MTEITPLTVEEEFRFCIEVIFNNWQSLKDALGMTGNVVPDTSRSKVEALRDAVMENVRAIMYENIHFIETVETIEEFVYNKFNYNDQTVEEVMNKAVHFYNLLIYNNRPELIGAMIDIPIQSSIINNKEYIPSMPKFLAIFRAFIGGKSEQ